MKEEGGSKKLKRHPPSLSGGGSIRKVVSRCLTGIEKKMEKRIRRYKTLIVKRK